MFKIYHLKKKILKLYYWKARIDLWLFKISYLRFYRKENISNLWTKRFHFSFGAKIVWMWECRLCCCGAQNWRLDGLTSLFVITLWRRWHYALKEGINFYPKSQKFWRCIIIVLESIKTRIGTNDNGRENGFLTLWHTDRKTDILTHRLTGL